MKLQELNVGMEVILQKCKDTITSFRKKKKHAIFKKIEVSMRLVCELHSKLEVSFCNESYELMACHLEKEWCLSSRS